MRNPGQQTPSAASVYEIMLRGYCILQPFLAPDFLEEAIASLKKRLAKAEEEARVGHADATGAAAKKRPKTTA